MENDLTNYRNHERIIAGVLRRGTWLASATIATGLAIEALHGMAGAVPHSLDGFGAIEAGVALFIFLPVLRVAVMLGLFLNGRDYVYAAISAIVLTIITAGFLAGLR